MNGTDEKEIKIKRERERERKRDRDDQSGMRAIVRKKRNKRERE